MKETTLLKIALICSLVGLAVLYFISTKIEPTDFSASGLSQNVGEDVRLKGLVKNIDDKGSVVFIEVEQQSPVTVVLFAEGSELKLNSGDNIEVFGKVQEYKGKNEIVAQKIMVIR